MAYSNKMISNAVSGQTIHFIKTAKETNGACLEMVSTWKPSSLKPPLHFHPIQSEHFEILEGTLTVQIDERVITLSKGEHLHIAPYTKHSMWNASDKLVLVHWKISPALQSEYFFEMGMGLAAKGKINKNGLPSLLQSALIIRKFRKEIRLATPPVYIQDLLTTMLTPLAHMCGLKAVYPEFID